MKLDPRTKFYMILIVSAVVMLSATTPFLWGLKIAMTLIPIILLIIEKKYTSAFGFAFLYIAALVLTFAFLSEESTGLFKSLLIGYSGIVVQFLPCFRVEFYSFDKKDACEWLMELFGADKDYCYE